MEKNNAVKKENIKNKVWKWSGRLLRFFARWFFLLSFVGVALFSFFVWYRYIWKADWDEGKKQQYISEQAKFSFDKAGYQKILELMDSRRDKLENYPRFTERDVFFPEGF